MRAGIAAGVLVGLALVAAPSARAVPFSTAFDPLIAQLTFRRDSVLVGELDKTQKKQLAAVNKVLAALEKPADDLGDDLKNVAKAAATLEKAFPEEFGAPAGGEFGDFLFTLLGILEGLVEDDFTDLEGSLGGLSDKGKAKVTAALDKASGGLDGEYDEFTLDAWGKALAKVYKSVAKGEKVVAGDPGPTQGFSATIDGKDYKPNFVEVFLGGGILTMGSGKTSVPSLTLSIGATAVTGTGTFPLFEATHTVGKIPPELYFLDAGTVTINSIDTTNHLIDFDFTFTAPSAIPGGGTISVQGSYFGPYTDPI